MDRETERVVPLDELPDVVGRRGEPDVRGWDVIASDGLRIGEVDELLVDPGAMTVRYLEVELAAELARRGTDTRHILIPMAYARLDAAADRVVLDEVPSTRIRSIPGPLVERERAICDVGHVGSTPDPMIGERRQMG